jgi:hypothetical protein
MPWIVALKTTALLLCALTAGCQRDLRSAGMTPSSQSAGIVRYFFVVPRTLPAGGPSTLPQKNLETWLIQNASGYTRLGACHGGWHDGHDLIEEDNVAYFIVGPDGLKPRIEKIIVEQFKQRQAFVVQW